MRRIIKFNMKYKVFSKYYKFLFKLICVDFKLKIFLHLLKCYKKTDCECKADVNWIKAIGEQSIQIYPYTSA